MKKSIGFFGIFSISAGAMISSGLFVLPGLAFAQAGPAVFLSYFIAGAIALTSVFSLTELVTAMPKAGGDYFYVSRSFGPLFGTVSGLLSWFALSLKSAFAIIGLAELTHIAFGINFSLSALIMTILFTLLNLVGVREVTRFQNALVLGLLGILGAFAFFGVQNLDPLRFEPFQPHGFSYMLSTAGFVFVSFGGVLTTAGIAGEVRDPVKNIPRGLIGSIAAVTLIYTVVVFIVVGVLPGETLSGSLSPVASAARAVGGRNLYIAVLTASLLAFVTTANGGILSASRYPVALARDGLLPRMLSKSDSKRDTPYAAIITTGVLIAISVLVNLEMLIKAASTVVLLTNIFAHLSVIVMRESKVANYLPTFRAPYYPWLQIGGILIFTLLIVDMGMQPILLSLIFVFIGVAVYFIRRGSEPEVASALVHLVQRITNQKLGTRDLADELRNIIVDRDEIVKDEFDAIIESAPVLDLPEKVSFETFLSSVSEKIHNSLPDLPANQITTLLEEREAESSTAISPFVAIPHIILEGSQRFVVVLVRAPKGIHFTEEHSSIKAVFVLMGTRDKRNLHLRALAAIAQIAQNEEFEARWLNARKSDLNDLILLSSRKRA